MVFPLPSILLEFKELGGLINLGEGLEESLKDFMAKSVISSTAWNDATLSQESKVLRYKSHI